MGVHFKLSHNRKLTAKGAKIKAQRTRYALCALCGYAAFFAVKNKSYNLKYTLFNSKIL
jgi:hypothetical protein